jgi:hypothetical protein
MTEFQLKEHQSKKTFYYFEREEKRFYIII